MKEVAEKKKELTQKQIDTQNLILDQIAVLLSVSESGYYVGSGDSTESFIDEIDRGKIRMKIFKLIDKMDI